MMLEQVQPALQANLLLQGTMKILNWGLQHMELCLLRLCSYRGQSACLVLAGTSVTGS